MVALSVIDIVLLIAGLAFYLYVVGSQLNRVATNLEECNEIVRTIVATPNRSSLASSTSTGPEAWSPEHSPSYMAWLKASSPVSPRSRKPQQNARQRCRPPVAAGRGCTTASATSRPTSRSPRSRESPRHSKTRQSGSRPVVSGPAVGAEYSPIHSSFHARSYCCSLQLGW